MRKMRQWHIRIKLHDTTKLLARWSDFSYLIDVLIQKILQPNFSAYHGSVRVLEGRPAKSMGNAEI